MRSGPSDSASESSDDKREASRIASSGGVTATLTASSSWLRANKASREASTLGALDVSTSGTAVAGTGGAGPQDPKRTGEKGIRPPRGGQRPGGKAGEGGR